MADNTFLIATFATGSDPDDWDVIEDLLSAESADVTLRALEWEFIPYSKVLILGDGTRRGAGYASATWKFKGLRIEQREALRAYCGGELTAEVYLRTPTNETSSGARTWGDFSGLLHWTGGAELVGVNYVEDIELSFTHLVEVGT